MLYYRTTSDGKFLGANPIVTNQANSKRSSISAGYDGSVFVTGELQRSKDLNVTEGILSFDSLMLATPLLTKGFFARIGYAKLSIGEIHDSEDFSALHLSSNPVYAEAVRLSFTLKKSGVVSASLYDPLGRIIDTQSDVIAGSGLITFDVSALPTSSYFILLRTTDNTRCIPIAIVH